MGQTHNKTISENVKYDLEEVGARQQITLLTVTDIHDYGDYIAIQGRHNGKPVAINMSKKAVGILDSWLYRTSWLSKP